MTYPDTPTQRFLASVGACSDAREWVGRRTLPAALRECDRGDWMLWLVGRTIAADPDSSSRKRLVWVACQCARLSLPVWEAHCPDDRRPHVAIETAERWTRGEATLDEVRAAAYAANAAAYAAYYAAYAAYAAANAAYAAYAAYAAAAYAAANAAYAAANAAYAAYAAAAYARGRVLRECADLCRAEWPACPVRVPRTRRAA